MRFYNRPHTYYCGIDLHGKTMYVCILDGAGQVLVHRNMPSTPAAFLAVVAPYRDGVVVAVECMFTWYYNQPCSSCTWSAARTGRCTPAGRTIPALASRYITPAKAPSTRARDSPSPLSIPRNVTRSALH